MEQNVEMIVINRSVRKVEELRRWYEGIVGVCGFGVGDKQSKEISIIDRKE